MYLIGTHIPIYIKGDQQYIDNSWFSDLDLLRQYFTPHFGEIKVIGPSLQLDQNNSKLINVINSNHNNLLLYPSINAQTRTLHFFPTAANQWQLDLEPLLKEATIVHAGVDNPFRPMQLATIRAAIRAGKHTVLVGPDTDLGAQLRDQDRGMGLKDILLNSARIIASDRWMRYLVRRASLSILKEGLTYRRYAKGAKNPKAFCHSMHKRKDVITREKLDKRLSMLSTSHSLKLVYFGRLIECKGLVDSLNVVSATNRTWERVTLDLIGEGPQKKQLTALARDLGIQNSVNFRGVYKYGTELFNIIRNYDALLFTPAKEETPRMVFDAYASGLPLITTDTPFLRTRSESDKASVIFRVGKIQEGAAKLTDLYLNRNILISLSNNAREAGLRHSVEHWYSKRLEWTLEVADHSSNLQPSPST